MKKARRRNVHLPTIIFQLSPSLYGTSRRAVRSKKARPKMIRKGRKEHRKALIRKGYDSCYDFTPFTNTIANPMHS